MPGPFRSLRRQWRKTPFSFRRNLPLALTILAVLVAFSLVMPLPSLQAFEGLGQDAQPLPEREPR